MKPVLSLVTGTLNRPLDFRRLVDSIEAHTSVSWELVCSDASDNPIENELVATAETWPKIRIIPEHPRKGCTYGYNRAFRAAKGKWIIWTNDDCEVMPGYDVAAISFMETHPEIGLGALYYGEPNLTFGVNTCSFGMLYANFGIISRELGNKVGFFDETLRMYGNDNSLAYRVLLAGKGIAGIPEARIFHHSTKDEHRRENNEHSFRVAQAELLKAKYGPYLPQMRETYERCRMVTA